MFQVSQNKSSSFDDYDLRNICGRFSLNTEHIDLLGLSSKISNASYNRKRLPAIVIRKTKPKGTILIFSNGKGMVIGLERIEHFELVCKRMAK
jgi:TATA-box binding protein (TBP) (component of TFIID and TFIIIB)